jgi:hypothetical protein
VAESENGLGHRALRGSGIFISLSRLIFHPFEIAACRGSRCALQRYFCGAHFGVSVLVSSQDAALLSGRLWPGRGAMFTMEQIVTRPLQRVLKCVWTLSGGKLICIWIEMSAATSEGECRQEDQQDLSQKVA